MYCIVGLFPGIQGKKWRKNAPYVKIDLRILVLLASPKKEGNPVEYCV